MLVGEEVSIDETRPLVAVEIDIETVGDRDGVREEVVNDCVVVRTTVGVEIESTTEVVEL